MLKNLSLPKTFMYLTMTFFVIVGTYTFMHNPTMTRNAVLEAALFVQGILESVFGFIARSWECITDGCTDA